LAEKEKLAQSDNQGKSGTQTRRVKGEGGLAQSNAQRVSEEINENNGCSASRTVVAAQQVEAMRLAAEESAATVTEENRSS